MNLFLDTEFNDYRGELISIALVSEQGHEFYEVLQIKKPYAPWVATHVVPYLGKTPLPRASVQGLLNKFLRQFKGVTVIADWPDDFKYLCQLMITGPGTCIETPNLVVMIVNRRLNSESSMVPHNALHDARAIRDMYVSAHTD